MSVRIPSSQLADEIVKDLLKINAIKLSIANPFVWASGWKSPIYCDNRLSLSFPEIRKKIKHSLLEVITNYFTSIDAIVGVATAGIPQGVLLAEEQSLPFLYVRSKSKGHGLQNRIEGRIEKGQKVVLIEDLISTGKSSLEAAEALREGGVHVEGVLAIFSYGFQQAIDNFEKSNVDLIVLSDYSHLLQHVTNAHLFTDTELNTLKKWRENPSTWSPTND